LYLLDGTNQISQSEFLNSSNIPNNPIFGDLKDIVEPNHAIDKFFLSAKACAGILRRKNERNMNMNSELEILLTRISKGEKIQTEKKSQHVTLCISNSGLSTKNEGVSVNQSSVLT
jgi:DNA (cytosine-5)-methyltransferase 1